MMDYRYGSHTVFNIEYHFVWVTKYRYHILKGDVVLRVRELVRRTCLLLKEPTPIREDPYFEAKSASEVAQQFGYIGLAKVIRTSDNPRPTIVPTEGRGNVWIIMTGPIPFQPFTP